MFIRKITLIPLLVASVVGLQADDSVVAAEKGWAQAVVSQNFAKLQRVLDEELIYAHSTGIIETKAEYLGKLKSGAQKYTAIDHHKTTVRVHGDAAVAHSIVVMQGNNASGPFDNRLMMIHTWVKKGGEWRLAAHQTTQIAR